MENSVADIEMSREGHVVSIPDSSYVAPALATPRMLAVSPATKVAFLLGVLVFALSRDIKLSLLVVLAQVIFSALVK
jgi:hypothetical protein